MQLKYKIPPVLPGGPILTRLISYNKTVRFTSNARHCQLQREIEQGTVCLSRLLA